MKPDVWSVPREWPDARCFIICGGESVKAQIPLIKRLRGRIIAVKHGVLIRPDADVMFITGDSQGQVSRPLYPRFRGRYLVTRDEKTAAYPPDTKRIGRTKDHTRLCDDPRMVSGYDGGTSAINLAYHFGAREIVMIGYDMTGGRWFNDQPEFRLAPPSASAHVRHMGPLPQFAKDAAAKGIRIVNVSPISAVTVFERRALESFL